MTKLFQAWEWQARPIQPRNRASDGSGVVWTVQAEGPPASEVYQLAHSDVIITLEDTKRIFPKQPVDVLASSKTVAALRDKPQSSQTSSQVDPWEHTDPWQASKQKQVKIGAPEISPQQMRALEESLQEKLMQNFPTKDDELMPQVDSQRVTSLEERMQRVEHELQQQSQTQQKHHAELTSSIVQVQRNLEQQGHSMNQVLDARFTEQLQQIERLLSKKQKTDGHE